MRVFSEKVYGIPPEQVIGSTGKLKFELRDGKPVLVKLPEIDFIDDKAGKPVGIQKHIGRRPILAFGNSDGDLQMLQWTAAGGGARFMGLVHHTDAAREWAYDRKSSIGRLAKALDEAQAKGWTVVNMKNEWKRVFPFDRKQGSRRTRRGDAQNVASTVIKRKSMKATNHMKSIVNLAAAAALAFAVVAPVHSQQPKAAGKQVTIEGVGVMELTRVTASVEAVDLANRIVTLKGPRGNVFAVLVGPEVKNLPQVKAGDTLEIEHYESVAIDVKKTEGVPSLTDTGMVVKAKPGEMPAGVALRKVRVVTNVLGINTVNQSVLVRGPLGHLTEVKIRDPKVVAGLKSGGQIDLTYVEGVAIAVKPGASRK